VNNTGTKKNSITK